MSTADLIGGASRRRDSSERSFWAGLLNKLGRHNLPVYLLLIGIAGCVAYGLSTVIRGLDLALLWMVGATAMLVGWFLARSLRSRGWATFWAALIGVVALFIRVGRLDRHLFQLVQGWIRYWSGALPYFWQILLDEEITVTPDPSLLLEALNELGAAINALLLRTGTWLIAIVRGLPLFDPAAAVLVWGLILWMAAVWAGWTVRRHGKVLVAVTPLGVLLAGVLSYVWAGPSALLFMAGITLLLMALVSHNHRESRWERSGIDYSSDLRTDLIGGAVILTLVLMSIAAVTPSVSFDDVVDFIRELQVEREGETDDVAESLGLEKQPQPRPPGTIDRARSGGLPRRHLIGSGPDLERKVVMVIATNELEPRPEEAMVEPAPRHYWRSATYDEYLGRGWYADSTRLQNYEPGETSNVTSIQYHRPLRQEVQVIGEIADLVYVSGVLVTTDQPYEVAWRSSGDLFAATIEAKSYRADSLISTADENMLREAHLNYPPWITERYLQLPETVPERVLALARDLTATEPTAYDRAVAIEEYLRTTFPYTLEVPLPPSDQDVVDYFLFDLQKGYCDYYASAMTVLARAAGLPARMVIGYAPGTYDPEEAHYVVTEADAHAWAEVFFPGYGWIEFEPTGSRPAMDRSAEEEPIQWPEPEESLRPPAPPPNPFIRYWYFALLGLAALAGLGGMVWAQIDLLWLRLTTSEKMVQTLYGRLRRWGDRLEVRMFEGDTPYEFTAAMKKRIVGLGQRQQQGRWVEKGLIAIEEIQRLVEDYVATLYSSRTLSDEEREVAIDVWHRLRWRFWLIWLWRYRYLYDRLFAPPTERRVPGEEWMPPTMPRF